MFTFQEAKPIWGNNLAYKYNQFLGFRTDIEIDTPTVVRVALAARSYYRIFINGKMLGNGPARTAKGYCRVDEYEFLIERNISIGVEVMAVDKPKKYSNDNTMEPGLFIMEVYRQDEEGQWKAVASTGNNISYTELPYRKSMAELMSHSRGIVEYYHLNKDSYSWLTKPAEELQKPIILNEEVIYLERRAPYPDYHPISFQKLDKVKQMVPAPKSEGGIVFELAKMFNPDWYEMLTEEDMFIDSLLAEKEERFFDDYRRFQDLITGGKKITAVIENRAVAFVFSVPTSEVGFIQLDIQTENEVILDIINTDYVEPDGVVKPNTYAARYVLQGGQYNLITFEPRLTKYVKLIIRTNGQVTFSYPNILDYSYPDANINSFACSDGELNQIYEGARRTLRLNTLDIFMDCPQRERGGWLCDSQFTAGAAWQLFGDLRVEKDFIENFMLTDPNSYKDAFFPEVYPGVRAEEKSPGIESWSFWLLTELWDYYKRSGDREFIEQCFGRVERFLDAVTGHIGESGLFENFEILFVDWSLSNEKFSLFPISIPINCLIVHSYELMSRLYHVDKWAKIAAQVRAKIETIIPTWGLDSDGYTFEDGQFMKNGCLTESGIALRLWSGFKQDDLSYVKAFVETMGTCPMHRSDPNIGQANLFIGLMVRFDVLAKLGKIDTLVRELKDVYLPQLLEGSGTLFESIHETSGCHGFNGMAGALIVNQVLGLGQPMQATKSIRISPHPGVLTWARGSAVCEDGDIFLEWSVDHDRYILDMELVLPQEWRPEIELPFELSGWTINLNGEELQL